VKAEREAVNTHDQLKLAGGGVAILRSTGGIRESYEDGWVVLRVNEHGQSVVTDPNAHFTKYGRKHFSNSYLGGFSNSYTGERLSHAASMARAFEEARQWVAAQGWYDGPWVGNRMRDKVPADINRRFPLRKRG